MSTHNDVPVVIVGAGPTGVTLAIELARRGVEISVLDKQPNRPREFRAIGWRPRLAYEALVGRVTSEQFQVTANSVVTDIVILRGIRHLSPLSATGTMHVVGVIEILAL
jgi:flavin-dependent dehydrogenase